MAKAPMFPLRLSDLWKRLPMNSLACMLASTMATGRPRRHTCGIRTMEALQAASWSVSVRE
jgi:hypothetical protein